MQSKKFFYFLYKKLIGLYPKKFKEQLADSMMQTFQDLWNEKQRANKDLFNFVFWTFFETAIGIFKEHFLERDIMQTTLKTIRLSALVSFLLIVPFLLMEFVNRQSYRAAGEEFPTPLFTILFICGMAFTLILAPIVQNLRERRNASEGPVSESGSMITKILANPIFSEIIVLAFALPFIGIWAMQILRIELPFIQALNQPDSDTPNFYNTVLPILGFILAMIGTFVARTSIVQSLQVQRTLFARPISLIVVLLMLMLLTWIWIGFISNQWPCFIGVQHCD